jgi:PAS domain S-box-containing protein
MCGILEAGPDTCYALDEDGRLLWWNDNPAGTLGYEDGTLEGAEFAELLPPEHREDARAAFEHTGSFPPSISLTFEVVGAEGERVPFEFNGARVTVSGETAVAGIGRDVSKQRERKKALRRQRAELDRLNRISETVYGVIRGVTGAAIREGIERVTCERPVDCDLYRAVWVGRNDGSDGVEPQPGAAHPTTSSRSSGS